MISGAAVVGLVAGCSLMQMKNKTDAHASKMLIEVEAGQTVVVGGLTAQTGFAHPQPEKRQLLVFVTARIVTTESSESVKQPERE